MDAALTDHEAAILDLAARRANNPAMLPGTFVEATRSLGYRYDFLYIRDLNRLLDTERALAADPILVNRLRARREANRGLFES